jgi:glycosyltransferase involved in cell wall biosynthesis
VYLKRSLDLIVSFTLRFDGSYMYSFPMRVLILNDLHPDEQAGAASVAFDFAVALSHSMQTTFVSTSFCSSPSNHANLEVKTLQRRAWRNLPGYFGEIQKFIIDLFGFSRAIRYFGIIKGMQPDVIWVHQIGNFIPRLILTLLSRIAPVVMTSHDFSLIVPRKLYPKDLHKSFLAKLGVEFESSLSETSVPEISIIKRVFYAIRRFILKRYLRKIDLVCISDLQAEIFRHFGFHVVAVIPNGISYCQCDDVQSLNRTGQVLFLGRLNGKGLGRLFISAIESHVKLTLAGSEELSREINSFPRQLDAKFLGKLSRSEVLREIHKTKFVYLASDCFDVYPTTGLEAIRHGAYPIVSDTTGLRDLVRRINPKLVLDSTVKKVALESFFQIIESSNCDTKQNLEKVDDSLLTVEQSLEMYLKIIKAY